MSRSAIGVYMEEAVTLVLRVPRNFVPCSAGRGREYAVGCPWFQHSVPAAAWILRHESRHPSSPLFAGRLPWQLRGWLHW